MLRHLRIRDLGVIADAEIELSDGLNVVTGETGAGKTMVVTGLGLLLGARADSALVRSGAEHASVDAEIDIEPTHQAARRVAEAGGDVADGVLLARSVRSTGRSRAFVGGRSAPVSVLSEVGESVVAIHGQAEQWRLRQSEQHRALLDDFAGAPLLEQRDAYQRSFEAWRRAQKRLQTVLASRTERSREAQMLRTALHDIDGVAPTAGEEDALAAEESRLAHADGLRSAAMHAHLALAGDDTVDAGDSAIGLLGKASHDLASVADHDPSLHDLTSRLAEITYLAADLATELGTYASGIESDPGRLAQVHQRRAMLTGLLRNYGATSAEVLRWADQARARLAEIDLSAGQIEQLQVEVDTERTQVETIGARLSAVRREAAEVLARRVTGELRDLAMGSASITVVVHPRLVHEGSEPQENSAAAAPEPAASSAPTQPRLARDDAVVQLRGQHVRARASGLDEVKILVQAGPDLPARPISKAASGGELSRVMLALELVCADSQLPTYVFDEVDAGVGGAAALELGSRLARLAESAQVIVVTHLGQVAAFAERHFVVDRGPLGQHATASVRAVDGADRITEVARMLGGESTSAAARDHAQQLLQRHAADERPVGVD
ncbi:MAG: DNA repair protein RecN [Ornithinimicrobium sp.]